MGKDKHKDKKRKRDKEDNDERRRAKAERLAAKVAKHLQKHDTHGYVDADNPFGDTNLSQKFIWGKKIEKQLADGMDVRQLSAKAERGRQEERLREIEKVKKRREEREAARAAQEEELNLLQRERGVAEAVELERKEELFHLEQARMRAAQRLREGRAKPVDIVAANLWLGGEGEAGGEAQLEEPYHALAGLTLPELRDLAADVRAYQELDVHEEQHRDFWAAMAVVVDAELGEAQRQDEVDRARLRGEPVPAHLARAGGGLHAALDADVQARLAGGTYDELEEMEAEIEAQLDSGEAADPEYWAAVLRHLRVHKARARLRNIHAALLREHLARMAQADGLDEVDVAEAMGWNAKDEADPSLAPAASPRRHEEQGADMRPGESEAALPSEPAGGRPAGGAGAPAAGEAGGLGQDEEEAEENVGQWSPPPASVEDVGGLDIVAEEDDRRLLELLRAQVKYSEAAKFQRAAELARAAGAGGTGADAERAYQQMVSDPGRGPGAVHPMLRYIADQAPQRGELAMRGGRPGELVDDLTRSMQAQAARQMGDMAAAGDAPFGGEVNVDRQVYWWHDKYRPRKPKYFNRVHTGYEWNKYNQTHYDHDNPPPKVVQGYKFNIFFPDLIDKADAPTYSLEKDPTADEHGSTCILRFHAGPPYEDIAFRIVNKEWEYSHKKGFKCTFERGILHLYFNFKRQRYRR